jgi:hypothetical protein
MKQHTLFDRFRHINVFLKKNVSVVCTLFKSSLYLYQQQEIIIPDLG